MFWETVDFIVDNIGWVIVIGFAYFIMSRPSTTKTTNQQHTKQQSATQQSATQQSLTDTTQQSNKDSNGASSEREVTVVPPPQQHQERTRSNINEDSNRSMSIDDALESRR